MKPPINQSLTNDPVYAHKLLDFVLDYFQKDADTFRARINFPLFKDKKYLLYNIEATLVTLMVNKSKNPCSQPIPTKIFSSDT